MERDDPIDLSDFPSSADDPRHRSDPYVLARLHHQLDEFAREAGRVQIDQDFIRRIRRAVLDGFQRLDALSRDDPFWEGTNRRPTFYKLPAFSLKCLHDNPGDARVLWTIAAVYVVNWSNFEPRFWTPFIPAGGLDASWPIYAALYVDSCCGTDSVNALVSLLQESGLRDQAQRVLERLARSDDQFIRQWAGGVAEQLQ
jgi:hypothetical protein